MCWPQNYQPESCDSFAALEMKPPKGEQKEKETYIYLKLKKEHLHHKNKRKPSWTKS